MNINKVIKSSTKLSELDRNITKIDNRINLLIERRDMLTYLIGEKRDYVIKQDY